MENASKALLIAGGVMIALLVATLGVYFTRNMAEESSRIYNDLEDSERTELNQQFLNYQDIESLNIVDVTTIINLAKDCNYNGKAPRNIAVITNIEGFITNNAENWTTDDINRFMEICIGRKFSCEVTINGETGYVENIRIDQE